MTVTNSYSRQPTKLDYASPTQFKFSIIKLPKVEYFCTAVNIPGCSLTSLVQPTPFKDRPLPGNDLSYEDLVMTFMIDENLENYQEIHNWLRGLGAPDGYAEFLALQQAGNDRFPGSVNAVSSEPGKVKYGAPTEGAIYSDATLTVLSSKNNPVAELRFLGVYPVGLSGLNYAQQENDIQYLTASVTFKYDRYDFATAVGAGTTTITHT